MTLRPPTDGVATDSRRSNQTVACAGRGGDAPFARTMNKHLPTSIAVLTVGTLAAAAALSSPGVAPSENKAEQKVEML